ncbi:TIGR01440 family protein [Ruminococcaceae bacterium OttesenSCG-928-I18]|nr:TIGR01440 family protein [Ruminococcaceae bacterium OttesenSCG-928-I18]
MLEEYTKNANQAMQELLSLAKLEKGDIVVVGCSTSEIAGKKIGTSPGPDIADALLQGLLPPLREAGLFLAAQCCEHLERALVVESEALHKHGLVRVNAIPQPKAGGSFATEAYKHCLEPELVQTVVAAAGLDIGGTMIGMHLRPVVVPLRLEVKRIGEATVSGARTRPRFVGGVRAVYDESLL